MLAALAGVRSDNVADDVWVEVQVAQHVGVHPHIVRLVEVRRPPSPPPALNRQPANGGKDAQVIRDDETDEIYLVMELMAKALAKGKKLKRDTVRQHMRSGPRPALPSASALVLAAKDAAALSVLGVAETCCVG